MTKEKIVNKLLDIYNLLNAEESQILKSDFLDKDFKNKYCDFKDLVDDRLQYVDAEIMYERHEKKQYANK